MSGLEEQLNGPQPPSVLDALDVELWMLTGPVRFIGERDHKLPLVMTFNRGDGTALIFRRWVDDDGDRYYLWPEFARRAGLAV